MQPLLEIFRDFAKKEGIADKAFIVGGAVRDILLSKELKDIDIAIIGEALNIAERFAKEINGSFVLLDKEFGTARVVKNGEFLDISVMRGDSILSDLSERDITINAMAIPLTNFQPSAFSLQHLIDPYNGKNDLFNGIIKMVSEENLIKDPLRILRIYRFAATLNFSVEKETLNAAGRLSPLITAVAVERITEELRHIIRLDDSYKTIKNMKDAGILSFLFIELKECSLELYKTVEKILNNPSLYFLDYSAPIFKYFETDYRKICLKLSTLFPDSDTARQSAMRLRMSKKEVEFIHGMSSNRNRIADLYKKGTGSPDNTASISLLKEFKDHIYPLAILSIAKEPPITSFCHEIIIFYNEKFKTKMDILPIITGNDLIKEFNLKPSPLFKKILAAVEDLVLEGRVASKEEALKAVRGMLKTEM
ncbi:MAG: hypothetical protein M1610_05935 [Nitrospirae bacterium]|nr:hypothetical protein [Nitrospirota bacterium]